MSANPARRDAPATVSGDARLVPFFLTQLLRTIRVWIERSHQRRQLGELADRKDHLLADIGLSVEEARHEAAKPFWACSAGRRTASSKCIDKRASPSSHSLAGIVSLVLLLTTAFTAAASRAEDDSSQPATFVFVCLHGSVKSQIAAAHFNRIAREHGLPVVAISRGIAVDDKIPAAIREGLAHDGLPPATDVPVGLTSKQAAAATKIYAFDEVPADLKGGAEVTYWSDVPPASEDYVGARSAIVRHLEEVIASIDAR